jgi:beta-lactamase regulating signal transducer with metallopeptidase domain
LLETLARLTRRLRIRRRVRLLVSATRIGPAVFGLFRPTIVLPEVIAADRTTSELEPILAHELIHVRRGDLWVGCLQTLTGGLWWFHPLPRTGTRGRTLRG